MNALPMVPEMPKLSHFFNDNFKKPGLDLQELFGIDGEQDLEEELMNNVLDLAKYSDPNEQPISKCYCVRRLTLFVDSSHYPVPPKSLQNLGKADMKRLAKIVKTKCKQQETFLQKQATYQASGSASSMSKGQQDLKNLTNQQIAAQKRIYEKKYKTMYPSMFQNSNFEGEDCLAEMDFKTHEIQHDEGNEDIKCEFCHIKFQMENVNGLFNILMLGPTNERKKEVLDHYALKYQNQQQRQNHEQHEEIHEIHERE